MAGLGYKDFTAGAVLTAAQVDGYLMEQAVMNFAGTAARGSALSGVVAAGMVAHVGAGTLTVYDGSAWQQVYPTSGGGAFKNLLYNGAMQVAQRGTATAGLTGSGYYTADRWGGSHGGGTWTQSVENDAPTGSGLSKSLKLLCTTAKASLSASDWVFISQVLEGQDTQRIAKGTANAKELTLSFWVKSNVTGTYTAFLYDYTNNRQVNAAYTISASATWEKKTITFPADTTGAIANNNAAGFSLAFNVAAGSNYTSGTLATTWATSVAANQSPGQVNLASAINNYWQVTGVQLEVGSQATAFEFKSFGQELRECQRYYWRTTGMTAYGRFGQGFNTATNQGSSVIHFPVTMRVAPTSIDTTATASNYAVYTTVITTATSLPSLDADGKQANAASVTTNATGTTSGAASQLIANNTTAAFLGFSAEL